MSRYLLRPADQASFSPNQATKADVVRGEHLFIGVNCFEPGQSQRVHSHRGADKFYLVLSGKARMAVGDDRFEAGPGDLVWAPAGIEHGVVEAIERAVMVVGLAPAP
jgi:quercetin dioxygenase-like cupin family protein